MTQTQWVVEHLYQQEPEIEIRVKQIQTTGDAKTRVPLTQIGGDGVFVGIPNLEVCSIWGLVCHWKLIAVRAGDCKIRFANKSSESSGAKGVRSQSEGGYPSA